MSQIHAMKTGIRFDFLHLFISEVRSQVYAQSSLKMKKGGLMAALCVDM